MIRMDEGKRFHFESPPIKGWLENQRVDNASVSWNMKIVKRKGLWFHLKLGLN